MKKSGFFLGLFLSLLGTVYAGQSHKQKVVKGDGVYLWAESFGNENDEPLLLIIGAETQGIMWPYEFCEQLAEKGFFVIRYDHRDTGLSSSVDYSQSPYTIMDLTRDAVAILDSYKIKAAHIIGASMGGEIAQFLGAYFPQKVLTLTLMMTSPNFEPFFDGLEGKKGKGELNPSHPEFIRWANEAFGHANIGHISMEAKMKIFMDDWRVCNGKGVPFAEEDYYQLGLQNIARGVGHTTPGNHIKAMKASYNEHKEALAKIKQTALIIHGDKDPALGMDHAQALHQHIQGSKLAIIEQMGHAICPNHYTQLIELIENHSQAKKR